MVAVRNSKLFGTPIQNWDGQWLFQANFGGYGERYLPYDEWIKEVPAYERFRKQDIKSRQLPQTKTDNIFYDIVLPTVIGSAITRGAFKGLGIGAGAKSGSGSMLGSSEALDGGTKGIEHGIASLIQKAMGGKTSAGYTDLPDMSKIMAIVEEHRKQNPPKPTPKPKPPPDDRPTGDTFKPSRAGGAVRDGFYEPSLREPPQQPTGGRGGASSGTRDIPPEYQKPPSDKPPPSDTIDRPPPSHRPDGEGHSNVPAPSPETLAGYREPPPSDTLREQALYRKKRGH